MDPDETLADLLESALIVIGAEGHASAIETDMAEKIIALDEWMRKGGYSPNRWTYAISEEYSRWIGDASRG